MIITDDHLNKIAKSAPNCEICHHFIQRIKNGEARSIDDIIELVSELAKQNEGLKLTIYKHESAVYSRREVEIIPILKPATACGMAPPTEFITR